MEEQALEALVDARPLLGEPRRPLPRRRRPRAQRKRIDDDEEMIENDC